MPAINRLNFYQRAYRINQAFSTSTLSTSSIKMGSITSPPYKGLAYYHTKSLYADIDSIQWNYNLFDNSLGLGSAEYYNINFATSVAGRHHDASVLANADPGPATPKLNQVTQITWDQSCYPCALGDTRDNTQWGDYRDGSWAEAGNTSNSLNFVNIYQADPGSGSPIWLNSILVNNNFSYGGPTSRNTRLFTSPSLTSDNIPGLGLPPGNQFIVYFGWDPYGNNGNPIFYYELFAFDYMINTLSSVNGGIDLTSAYGGFYETLSYTGKHDIFHTAQWQNTHSYTSGVDFLMIFAPSGPGNLYQFDLLSGAATFQMRAQAGAYCDIYDIFCVGDGTTRTFYTFLGKLGISSASIDTAAGGINMNLFDADYYPFPAGKLGGVNDEYFYFGDDQQSATGKIVGWSIRFDPGGTLSMPNYGAYFIENTYTGGPYTLKRVVVVAPMQLVVGSGPNLGTQNLMRITCGWYGGYWYRTGAVFPYTAASQNEDYIAMDHGYCEDYTGYFHTTGQYQSGLPQDLFVGAGNRHILSIGSNMLSCLSNHNVGSDYDTRGWSGAPSDHYNYVLYLGHYPWSSSTGSGHTGNAYLYINVTGGSSAAPFLNPVSSLGSTVAFSGAANGRLRMMAFWA